MDTKNLNFKMIVVAILIVVVVFFGFTQSFKNNIPNCDGYITNSYLYILLGILILIFSILFIIKRNFAITGTKSLIFFAVAIVALFSLYMINPKQVLLNHIMWLIFIIALSVPIYAFWRYSDYRNVITITILGLFLIVAGLTILTVVSPDSVTLSWSSVLVTALVSVLLAWLLSVIFGKKISNTHKGLGAICIFALTILILYNTKSLRKKAEQCTIPDYPNDSLGLFIDIINFG